MAADSNTKTTKAGAAGKKTWKKGKEGDKPRSLSSFAQAFAEKLVAQMEAGTSPYQKEWRHDGPGVLPMNLASGRRYRGINLMILLAEGHEDPRWLTYRQAEASGAQVRRGEHGTVVQYWKFDEERDKTDGNGKPVLGPDGKPQKVTVKLDRPRVFYSTVFNAEQIDGLPPLEKPDYHAIFGNSGAWEDNSRVEALMALAGPAIIHGHIDRAFYRPSTDEIHLPLKEQFKNAAAYYATALHEVAHSTGHQSRLDRDLSGGFGSESYAMEELRAETFSLMAGETYGVGYLTAENHAAYIKTWIRILKDDPQAVFRAAADAEKIMGYMARLEQSARQAAGEDARTFLNVPYGEKDEAKALGAEWDADRRAWFVPEGLDPTPFVRWTGEAADPFDAPGGHRMRDKPSADPSAAADTEDPADPVPVPAGQEGEVGQDMEEEGVPAAEGRQGGMPDDKPAPLLFPVSIAWQETDGDRGSAHAGAPRFFLRNEMMDAEGIHVWMEANQCRFDPDTAKVNRKGFAWFGEDEADRPMPADGPQIDFVLRLGHEGDAPLDDGILDAFKAALRKGMPSPKDRAKTVSDAAVIVASLNSGLDDETKLRLTNFAAECNKNAGFA